MKSIKTLLLVMAAWAGLSFSAGAQQFAYTARDAELHAGPAFEYPVVAIILNNIAISVEGCIDGYQWCDVIAGPYRGWMYAGDVVYPYQGGYYPISSYGPMIGLTIIGFSTAIYWDRYYRGSPWYVHRNYWVERPRSSFREVRPYPPPPRADHERPVYGREPEHRKDGRNISGVQPYVGGGAAGTGGGVRAGNSPRTYQTQPAPAAPPVVQSAPPVVHSSPPVVSSPAPGTTGGTPSTRRATYSSGNSNEGSSSGSSGGGGGGGGRSHEGGGGNFGGGGNRGR